MRSFLRRLAVIAGLCGALWASQRWWRSRTAPAGEQRPATPWPPLPTDPGAPAPLVTTTRHDPMARNDAAHGQGGRLPIGGACPDDYPVKAKDRSHIYHLPGMAAYERTVPDRCYRTESDAEADGFRRAKH